MYQGNAKRQRFADGRSFWYLFAFRVGVNGNHSIFRLDISC